MRSAKIKRISKSNQQSKCKYFHNAKIWVGANSNSPLMMIASNGRIPHGRIAIRPYDAFSCLAVCIINNIIPSSFFAASTFD